MSDINHAGSDLIFELEDRPPFHQALVGAITHLLAIFVPMVTPALIVGAALQLSAETTAYLVSMAMIASGIGTWLQVNRYGIVGSGLLSIQSVNFSFVTVMIALGSSMKSDGFHEELIMSSLLGVSFVGAFLVVGSSFILPYLRRVITPTVSGIVVLMIGLSLIKVGIIDFGGGFAAKSSGTFGNYEHLGVGLLVLIVVIGFNCCRSPLLRMGGIAIGLCVGYIASLCLGMVDFSSMRNLPLITIPHPFKYGFSFSFHQFLVVGTIYLLSVLEAVGDITATAMVSRRPIQGEEYQSRLKGGVLANGLNSFVSAVFNTFPNSCFGQNNGVIQLTGVASRYVGFVVALMLIVLGLFPAVSGFVQHIPEPVLGGATLVMFGTIAASGVRIVSREPLNRRAILIIALSLAVGLGVSQQPLILQFAPEWLKNLLSSGIAAGGITAIVLNLIFPPEKQ
ncbi:nucleobase:cation symporter-2 family protein [Escherichia coli]|uniref:nucleobase:cation symporter-2 family protein n=1 Tax=Escherichia coli TaxID=562 RepID=UPI000D86B1A7|nr:NCS2 family protein [Escherichia coli]PYH10850.1 xanthine permease XanP [Escherichia coli]